MIKNHSVNLLISESSDIITFVIIQAKDHGTPPLSSEIGFFVEVTDWTILPDPILTPSDKSSIISISFNILIVIILFSVFFVFLILLVASLIVIKYRRKKQVMKWADNTSKQHYLCCCSTNILFSILCRWTEVTIVRKQKTMLRPVNVRIPNLIILPKIGFPETEVWN